MEIRLKAMIQLNPQYEAIFDARNIDEDCNKIADEINDVARMQIKEILAVGMYKQGYTVSPTVEVYGESLCG